MNNGRGNSRSRSGWDNGGFMFEDDSAVERAPAPREKNSLREENLARRDGSEPRRSSQKRNVSRDIDDIENFGEEYEFEQPPRRERPRRRPDEDFDFDDSGSRPPRRDSRPARRDDDYDYDRDDFPERRPDRSRRSAPYDRQERPSRRDDYDDYDDDGYRREIRPERRRPEQPSSFDAAAFEFDTEPPRSKRVRNDEEDFAPPPQKKRSGASTAGIVLSCIAILLLIGANAAWTWLSEGLIGKLNIVNSNTKSDVVLTDDQKALLAAEEESESDAEVVSDTNAVPADVIMSDKDVDIILLVGCDSRVGGKDASRSDSIMLGVIDRKHQKIKLISILRDMYSQIPGYKKNKFNTAFYYDTMKGNMDLKITRGALEKNLGITVDDFVAIDFSAFKKLVDKLGGVTMEVTAAEADYMCHNKKYGKFPRYEAGAGTYTMNGAEALNYARMRKESGNNGDFSRTERQRKLLEEIMNEALKSNRSYVELAGIASELLPYVTTNISEQRIYGYMAEALDILKYDIVQYTIPINGTWRYCDVQFSTGSASVISVNYKFNSKQLKSFIYDDDMTYVGGKKAKGVSVPTITNATKATTTTAAPAAEAPAA